MYAKNIDRHGMRGIKAQIMLRTLLVFSTTSKVFNGGTDLGKCQAKNA